MIGILQQRVAMTHFIDRLPESLVLIIREYVLDMETRIEVLIDSLKQDYGSSISPASPLPALMKTFSSRQLISIYEQFVEKNWDRTLYNQNFLKGLEGNQVSTTTTFILGLQPLPWAPHDTPPYVMKELYHPINGMIEWAIFRPLGRQKSKQIDRFISIITFLRFTSIFHKGFDHAIRKQLHDLVAGMVILRNNMVQKKQLEKQQLQLQKNLKKLQSIIQKKLDKQEKLQNQNKVVIEDRLDE
uniref:Uncharacterized protein n=1 Tax=viral metagenome TaxID=1070528 RepID=A0A6C0I4F5_9ZZZZ